LASGRLPRRGNYVATNHAMDGQACPNGSRPGLPPRPIRWRSVPGHYCPVSVPAVDFHAWIRLVLRCGWPSFPQRGTAIPQKLSGRGCARDFLYIGPPDFLNINRGFARKSPDRPVEQAHMKRRTRENTREALRIVGGALFACSVYSGLILGICVIANCSDGRSARRPEIPQTEDQKYEAWLEEQEYLRQEAYGRP